MLISELPQPYKALAEKRRKEYNKKHEFTGISDNLAISFFWNTSKERRDFWYKCDIAKTESELPPYPNE